MFYKQNGIVAGILLLILFAGAIGLVSVQMDKTVNRMHYSVDGTDPAGSPKDGRAG